MLQKIYFFEPSDIPGKGFFVPQLGPIPLCWQKIGAFDGRVGS
jgi:hypothetical protein